MKPRTVTIRLECQTNRPLRELRDVRHVGLGDICTPTMFRRGLHNHWKRIGEIVQVSVDVAQPVRATKRKAKRGGR